MTFKIHQEQAVVRHPTDEDSGRRSPGSGDAYPAGPPEGPVGSKSDEYKTMVQKAIQVDRDTWLNSKLLKILGIVYGLASPFIVWLVVTIYDHKTVLAVQDAKINGLSDKLLVIEGIYTKMDQMNNAIQRIQIDIATLKAKAGIP